MLHIENLRIDLGGQTILENINLDLAAGHSNKVIARHLELAESTVKVHVQNLLRKLDLSSRVQAAVYAVQHKVPQPEIN